MPAAGRAFIRFDYLGHGVSSGQFADGTIGRWRDDALAILDELSNGPQILVGSSMGGWLSLLVTLVRPQRIAGIVTIAAAADFTEDLIWQQLPASEQERLRRDGVWHRPSEYQEQAYPITYRLIQEARQHLLLQQTEIAIDCPVRLLHGMQDIDVPWQTSTGIAQRLRSDNVQVILIKDGEHRLSRPQDLALLQTALTELIE
ncbi:MAG: alpha/beta hydrolase [Gammaproteobacteria bacterium]